MGVGEKCCVPQSKALLRPPCTSFAGRGILLRAIRSINKPWRRGSSYSGQWPHSFSFTSVFNIERGRPFLKDLTALRRRRGAKHFRLPRICKHQQRIWRRATFSKWYRWKERTVKPRLQGKHSLRMVGIDFLLHLGEFVGERFKVSACDDAQLFLTWRFLIGASLNFPDSPRRPHELGITYLMTMTKEYFKLL